MLLLLVALTCTLSIFVHQGQHPTMTSRIVQLPFWPKGLRAHMPSKPLPPPKEVEG
jgi:hypothetical protein